MFGSRDDQHRKNYLNWLLIDIKPILKVIDQLLNSIHGHTYRAARAAEKNSFGLWFFSGPTFGINSLGGDRGGADMGIYYFGKRDLFDLKQPKTMDESGTSLFCSLVGRGNALK